MQEDQFERLLPTFIQVIELTEDEECEYWSIVSAVFEGKEADSIDSRPSLPSSFTAAEAGINNKAQLQFFCHLSDALAFLLMLV